MSEQADWEKLAKTLAKIRDAADAECTVSTGRQRLFWNRAASKAQDVLDHVKEALDERAGKRRCTHVGDDIFGCGECSR